MQKTFTMDAKTFVNGLKKQAQEGIVGAYDYLINPPVTRPPDHLGKFYDFLKELSDEQKQTVKNLMHYMAEGALFELLGVLDGNYAISSDNNDRYELYHVDGKSGNKSLLNYSEDDTLQDIFNNEP